MTERIDYSKLTDSEIDELMGKLMGWHIFNGWWCIQKNSRKQFLILISHWHPSFNLNQVRDCEKIIKDTGFVMDYCRELVEIVGKSYERFIYATARQRCEAMLMAMKEE